MNIADILKGELNRQQKTNTSWLVTTIKEIPKTPIQKLDQPIFLFNITNKAAARNIKILSALNCNLGAALAAQKGVPLNYGSEFRDPAYLS